MIRQITFTALSAACIAAGVSAPAIAASKKGEAPHASAAQPADWRLIEPHASNQACIWDFSIRAGEVRSFARACTRTHDAR
jgi:hypothetical protein